MSTPMQFMDEYTARTNTHQFDNVAELIADDAIFIFTDGTYRGIQAIRQAFEETWAYIKDETYNIDNLQWLAVSDEIAVCIYLFHWQGPVNGQPQQGSGRGTSVVQKTAGHWQVIHEHLSPEH